MNIGIVGLGHLGRIHLKLLLENSLFEVSSVFDINTSITNELATQHQLHVSSNFESLLKQCEAVCIVTPTPTHFELASLAIKQGKHVFLEKPSTNHVDDTKKLIRLAKEANVIVQVGHVERFNPAFMSAKPYINNPIYIEATRYATYNVRGTDVSVVLDLMIHDIDLVLSSVKSNIKRISATGTKMVSNTTDMANARIEFENGTVANLTTNRVALQNIRKIEMTQSKNYLTIDLLNKTAEINRIEPINTSINANEILIDTGVDNQIYQITQTKLNIQPINAIKKELDCFYESVINNKAVAVSLRDAESALFVAQEIESQINR